jgi:hypothetical protein
MRHANGPPIGKVCECPLPCAPRKRAYTMSNAEKFLQLEGEERARFLASLPLEESKELKRDIIKALGLAGKPSDPRLLELQEHAKGLEEIPDVQDYIQTLSEIKKLRGRTIVPGWARYAHDEKFKIIRLEDGTELDTDQKGWRVKMADKGYRPGQVAAVAKEKKAAANGKTIKSTL